MTSGDNKKNMPRTPGAHHGTQKAHEHEQDYYVDSATPFALVPRSEHALPSPT